MIDGKMFPSKSMLKMLFCGSGIREDGLFENIHGYDDIKRLFRMALESDHRSSILLTGPPASAKTLFLQSLMKLKSSHFIDCSNATRSGVVDYVFKQRPNYLLLDELDKLSSKDQTFLLNLIETGIVSETKYGKTRKMELKTSVFATCNNVEKVILPLVSRFFIVKLQAYTYEQFYDITVRLFASNSYNVDGKIAKATIESVWKTSKNIRDSIKIAKMAKSAEEVDWLATTFLGDNGADRAVHQNMLTIFSNKFPEYCKDLRTK
jgi:Holliday junction DNA helicase RuvB